MVAKKSIKRSKFYLPKLSICLFLILGLSFVPLFGAYDTAEAEGGLSISTRYPGMTVKAGEDVEFSIRVENESAIPQNVALSVSSIPEGWDGYFEGLGNPIQRVFVNKGDYTHVDFKLKIPSEAAEDNYQVVITAQATNASDTLTLDLKVSKEDVKEGEFVAQYPELQGPSDATFEFRVDLKNNSSKDQSYSLAAQAPRGWEVTFSPSYEDKQIASISLEADKNKGLDVKIKPPRNVKAGKYKIPISATSADEELTTELIVIIAGTYDIKLTTPNGRLNVDAYAGSEAPVTLKVINDGSADLKNVTFSSWEPKNWSVRFEPESIDVIPAGESKEVKAYIKPAARAIAGDYVVSITAEAPETSSDSEFRVTVKTPTTWGIVGIIIILLLVGGLFWTFKAYGRR